MKPSTVKCLLAAIVLPFFALTLSMATPASAEQIARSRSITARESRVEDPVPSVTDLNLSVPIYRQYSGEEIPVRSNTSPKRSITSLNSRQSQRSIEQSISVRSSSSKSRFVTMNPHPVASINIKSKPISNQRIAAISPPPLSGNYFRLVRDPSNRTNDLGNPLHILEVYRNGIIHQKFKATSGTASSQNRDRSIPDIAAPLQDGSYRVSGQIVPGAIPEVGKTFIAVFPRFVTARTDLGVTLPIKWRACES
jgi:hypothetical protein